MAENINDEEQGILIVVEGACDGIGKSTQYELLKKALQEAGYEVVSHHFPSYDTPQGKPVEKYLAGDFGKPSELSPYFVNTLYAMDRAITWKETLEKEYKAGKVILLDRYTTSSLIYQSSVIEDLEERKKFIDYVCDYEYSKLGIQKPDKVIFLHAPFDLVTEMRNARKSNEGLENDIHERDIEFMKRVYENSMSMSEYLGWDRVDCTNGDSMDTIENIHQKVLKRVKNIL